MRVRNTNRYVKVVQLRAKGKTFQEIAKELKVSRQRVYQIYQRALSRPSLVQRVAA